MYSRKRYLAAQFFFFLPIWSNTMRASNVSAASHSVSPATSSQGPVGIIWSVIAAHKWATPHEWKCSKASAAMITLCSQVIALTPLSLSSPCSHALPVEWEDKSSAGETQKLWQKKRRGWYRQSIITYNETFVLEHYRDVLEVTLEVVFRWRKRRSRLKSPRRPSHPYVQ